MQLNVFCLCNGNRTPNFYYLSSIENRDSLGWPLLSTVRYTRSFVFCSYSFPIIPEDKIIWRFHIELQIRHQIWFSRQTQINSGYIIMRLFPSFHTKHVLTENYKLPKNWSYECWNRFPDACIEWFPCCPFVAVRALFYWTQVTRLGVILPFYKGVSEGLGAAVVLFNWVSGLVVSFSI